jgi:hypothetical protein
LAALDIEISARNARLRAIRAAGSPLSGRWERAGAEWRLALFCTACRKVTLGYLAPNLARERGVRAALEGGERVAARDMRAEYRCPHADPLLADEDSEEVRRLTALELLAG